MTSLTKAPKPTNRQNQHTGQLTSTVMIGVRGGGHFSAVHPDSKPPCSQLLPTTQQLCNILDNQDHSLTNSPNNFQIKQELQSGDEEDNPAQLNVSQASPETKQHFKTEESEDLPIIESVESLSEASVKQKEDGRHCQPKGLPTSPQHFGHQVNVKEEMESYDDPKSDLVYQPANTCDGNAENDASAIITSVQSEEHVEAVTDIGGRSSNMEESDEDLEMTVEEGEVFCQKRANWFSEVVEKEDADSLDHGICNDDLHDQNDALQGKLQGQHELREDSSFGVMTMNENKEEDGGISERKTQELSSKDKKSEKQPNNHCVDNLLRRKSNSTRSSLESSQGHHKKNQATHQCDVCGYSTNKKSTLTSHTCVHTKEKPFVCDICNKSFTQKGHLQRHNSLHSNEKQFQCDICRQRFSVKENMKRHLRIHTGIKPFKCKTCGVYFTRQSTLTNHKKIQHEKNAPLFPCKFCKHFSKHKCATKDHEIRMHTNKYPHNCNVCDLGFITPGRLQKHMINKHKQQK